MFGTSAGAQHGLWHMYTVVFVKIGYKGAEESRGEQSRRTDQVTYRALGSRQSQKLELNAKVFCNN